MDVQKAIAFVRDNGNDVELARLGYLLTENLPSQEVIDGLLAGQRGDGGWAPFWAGDYSSLDATCFRLAQAEQLGLGAGEPPLERAVAFLAGRQRFDGRWQEDDEVAGVAPPWVMPGEVPATLYLTANCGLWLALLGESQEGDMHAAGYLQRHLGDETRLQGFIHTQWLAGGLWLQLGWQEPAERVFAYLDSRMADLTASNLSWLITALAAAGMGAHHPLLRDATVRLESLQEENGSWRSEDGSERDVHVTLEALRGLSHSGRL